MDLFLGGGNIAPLSEVAFDGLTDRFMLLWHAIREGPIVFQGEKLAFTGWKHSDSKPVFRGKGSNLQMCMPSDCSDLKLTIDSGKETRCYSLCAGVDAIDYILQLNGITADHPFPAVYI